MLSKHGANCIPVAAYREACKRKGEYVMNEMTIQLSRGHAEITNRRQGTILPLNDKNGQFKDAQSISLRGHTLFSCVHYKVFELHQSFEA